MRTKVEPPISRTMLRARPGSAARGAIVQRPVDPESYWTAPITVEYPDGNACSMTTSSLSMVTIEAASIHAYDPAGGTELKGTMQAMPVVPESYRIASAEVPGVTRLSSM